ncbi:MAG: archaetidylserine decarboxylase [Sandaracinaceae bacterium]
MPSLVERVAAETLRWLPRKRLSRGLGRIASSAPSRAVLDRGIDLYCKAYDVDLDEAIVPSGGFRTFDDFFTRELRPGQRPIEADANALVSPADGKVESAGPIERGARFTVKGCEYDVGALLGDPADAGRFEGGWYCIVYLSPRDYHRVHAPVGGPVLAVRHVGGTLLPVNGFGVKNYPGLFSRNERVCVFQQSEHHGEVATVMVGAIGVGRISVSFDETIMTNVGRGPTTVRYQPGRGPSLERGGELGKFHLGSTAIVLTGPDHPVQAPWQSGDRVWMGQRLATRSGGAGEGTAE